MKVCELLCSPRPGQQQVQVAQLHIAPPVTWLHLILAVSHTQSSLAGRLAWPLARHGTTYQQQLKHTLLA